MRHQVAEVEIVTRLTEAIVRAGGGNVRSVTWVVPEDVENGDQAIGGNR